MKKLFPWLYFVVSIFIASYGCNDERSIPIRATDKTVGGWEINEVSYEGCQYLTAGHGFTHKGNCNNSIHYK